VWQPLPSLYGRRREFAAEAYVGKRVGTPKVACDRAAGRFGFRSARRRFHIPSVAAAPLRADGCHAHCHGLTRAARAKARHTGRQRFPHGRFGMIKPSARVAAVGRTVRSPPLACRRGIASASASEPRKSRATERQAVSDSEAHADVFISPVWQPRRYALTAATALPRAHTRGAASQPYGTATVPARSFRDDKTQRPCGSRWPYRTVAAACLPQRNRVGQRVGTPKVASDRAAGRFGVRSARRRFHVPSVAAAPLRADGCHATGRGRRQPGRRGAVFARGYTPQSARPPPIPAAATPRQRQTNNNRSFSRTTNSR